MLLVAEKSVGSRSTSAAFSLFIIQMIYLSSFARQPSPFLVILGKQPVMKKRLWIPFPWKLRVCANVCMCVYVCVCLMKWLRLLA